jgi:hypothetical protein
MKKCISEGYGAELKIIKNNACHGNGWLGFFYITPMNDPPAGLQQPVNPFVSVYSLGTSSQ